MHVTCEKCHCKMDPVVNTAVLFSLITDPKTTMHYVCINKKCLHEQDVTAALAIIGGKRVRLEKVE